MRKSSQSEVRRCPIARRSRPGSPLEDVSRLLTGPGVRMPAFRRNQAKPPGYPFPGSPKHLKRVIRHVYSPEVYNPIFWETTGRKDQELEPSVVAVAWGLLDGSFGKRRARSLRARIPRGSGSPCGDSQGDGPDWGVSFRFLDRSALTLTSACARCSPN